MAGVDELLDLFVHFGDKLGEGKPFRVGLLLKNIKVEIQVIEENMLGEGRRKQCV